MSLSLLQNARRIVAITLIGIAATATAAQPQSDSRGLPTLAPVVNAVTPAVVNISVITRSPMEDNPLFRDPFFRRFFNLPDRPQREEQAAGSGVIVDAAHGYVLTNHHVIKDAEQAIVTLKDRRQFHAKAGRHRSRHRHRRAADRGAEPHARSSSAIPISCRSATT